MNVFCTNLLLVVTKVKRNNNNLDLHNNSCPNDMLVVLYFMVVNILCGFLQTSLSIAFEWMVGF
jgi:hypothetical protein